MNRSFVLALAVVSASCGPSGTIVAAPRLVVATQVPAAKTSDGFEPRTRWPDGSRVVALDLARPDAAPRVLSEGLVAAGGASVRWDAARVAFAAKENASDRFAVFTCAPDGSDRVRACETAADCGAAAFLADGRIVFSAATPEGGWALFTSGAPPQRITFSGGADVDPTALADGRVAFASRASGGTGFQVLAVHVDGTGVGALCDAQRPRALLAAADDATSNAAWKTIGVVPLAATRKPQGHLSVVDAAKPWGDVFCIDARPTGEAVARRVRFTQLDAGGRALGDVALEKDGSFFVRVPTDAPLGLALLDADGRVVATQHAPIWTRPGETRGCIGCHEDGDTAPPNVRPLAVTAPPVPLGVAGDAR